MDCVKPASPDPACLLHYAQGYLDAPVSAAIFSTPTIEKRHTSDVWWMDPRQDSVYCSWGWQESDFDVFKVGPLLS